MLHIFLVIIKIIGILLAAVLGIVLLLLLLLLFCPLFYQLQGRHQDEWNIEMKAHFIGPVVMFHARYQGQVQYKLRIFGLPIMNSKRQDKKEKKNSGKTVNGSRKSNKKKDKHAGSDDIENTIFEHIERTDEGDSSFPEDALVGGLEKEAETDENDEPLGFFKRIKNFWNSIIERMTDFWASLKDKIQTVKDALKNITVFMEHLWQFYEDEGVRTGFSKLKKELFYLLKKIKPRKCKWYLKFGFEDPSSTGQVLGVIAALSGIWGKKVHVEPDFENKVFETDFKVKGMIQGVRLVRLGVKVLYDDDIQYFLKQGKGLRRNENGR